MKPSLTINGEVRELAVEPYRSLLDVLRNEAALTGTKKGCDVGDCGACTVILDGKPVNSCLMLRRRGRRPRECTTIEGVQLGPDELHPLQENFIEIRRRAVRLLHAGHHRDGEGAARREPAIRREEEIRFGIAGNICRCTGYTKIIEAIQATARDMAAAGGSQRDDVRRRHQREAPGHARQGHRRGASTRAI